MHQLARTHTDHVVFIYAGQWPQRCGAPAPGRWQVRESASVQPHLHKFCSRRASAHLGATAFSRRRQAVFKGVRPSVRVFAEAPAAGQAAKAPAMRLEDVKEGAEYEGTVVRAKRAQPFAKFQSAVC